MSRINKHKHVMNMDGDYDEPAENQQYARILKSRGNNLHEVEPAVVPIDPDGDSTPTFLVSMPTKFRKNIWVKRGNIVVIEMIPEGRKVCGEIVRILQPDQVRDLKKLPSWPVKFNFPIGSVPQPQKEAATGDESSDADSEPEFNANRRQWNVGGSGSEDSSSEEDDDESVSDDDNEEEIVDQNDLIGKDSK